MGTLATSIPHLFAAMATHQRRFFDGVHLVDRKRREFNPGRIKAGQGAKYSGADLRELRALRGVGSVRRIRIAP